MTSFSRWHIIYEREEDDLTFNLENVGGGGGEVVRNVDQELNIGYLRTIRGIGDMEVITSGNEIIISYQGTGGTGDLVGPDGATPNGVLIFGDATGKLAAEGSFRMIEEGLGASLLETDDPNMGTPMDVIEVYYEGPNGSGTTQVQVGDWQYSTIIHNPRARRMGGIQTYPVLHEGIDAGWNLPAGGVGGVDIGYPNHGSMTGLITASFAYEYDNGDVSGATTIDWNNGQKQRIRPVGNTTFTFTNPAGPGNFILRIEYGSGGPYTFTWPFEVKWFEDTEPEWTFINFRFQVVGFYFTGVEWAAAATPWMYSQL